MVLLFFQSYVWLWEAKVFAVFGLRVTQIVKLTNHTQLWDAEFTWYSRCATSQNWVYGLGIHGLKPTWPCLGAEVLATRTKFLQRSGYFTVIMYIFTFHARNILFAFAVNIYLFWENVMRWMFGFKMKVIRNELKILNSLIKIYYSLIYSVKCQAHPGLTDHLRQFHDNNWSPN